MTFYTEDEDTVNQVVREEENEIVQGAYFPQVHMMPDTGTLHEYYQDHLYINWERYNEDYEDEDHKI